jgi:hypothetical protein
MKWLTVGCLIWLLLARQGGQFESKAAVTFGQQVVFTLTAVTDEPPTAVSLTFQPSGQAEQTVLLRPPPLADGRWQVQFTLEPQAGGLSPYTTLTYKWSVTADSGETITVPAQTVAYQDDRFAWKRINQRVANTAVSIFWPGESDKPGQEAFIIVQETAARLHSLLPLPPETPLPIFLYPSTADLRSALRLNGHDWVQAHTDPALGVVLVTAVNSKTVAADLRRTLPHEMARFWLYQAAGARYTQIPYWFKEGVALWAAQAAGKGMSTPVPLADLCQAVPPEAADQQAVVAQSGAMVQFVDEWYGREALAALAAAFAGGADCETAVQTALGQSVAELEATWLKTEQPRPAAVRFVQQNGGWLLLAAAGFLFMMLLLAQPTRR